MDLELRHLRTLLAVVDTGTFTAAATRLHTTQASVSRTVAALERALGTRVLHRTTRETALTPAGTRVAQHARRVLAEVDILRRAAQEARAELRVGYPWAALGRHTTPVQRAWAAAHPGSALVFVQSNTPTAGLVEGTADVAVLRRAIREPRLATALLGTERRSAALAADDPLARRRSVRLTELADRTVAVDGLTGTTTESLWAPSDAPATRTVRGVDEWLTAIAAGGAVGITTEATAAQHRRPGVVYRPVRDAPPVEVRLAWWAAAPPPALQPFLALVRDRYAAVTGAGSPAPG